jgi:dTDP-4-dehydrorhamnose 3,5-epimerase
MRFAETQIGGLFQVDLDLIADERGFFTRLHCERDFADNGLAAHVVQTSLSFTSRRGAVRGMHFQWPPARESKLVRCIRGRVFDAVIDLRPGSSTFGQHFAVELSSTNHSAVFIPPGLAHGFQTLEDSCEVLYQMTDFHAPVLSTGVRWNDPAFAIAWPLPCSQIHSRDAAYPDFDPVRFADELGRHGVWGAE